MISSTVRKVGPFVGNGVDVTFPFTFKVFAADDLEVVVNDGGSLSTLVLTTDYSAILNSDQDTYPGGSITLVVALPVDDTLIISSDVLSLQETEITNFGGFYPEVITAEFDKLTILIQQLQEEMMRTVKFPITDASTVSAVLPASSVRAGLFLSFTGDGSVTVSEGGGGGGGGGGTPFSGVLTGTKNGSNTVFAFTNGGVSLGIAPIQAVVWNNFPLIPGVGYTLGPLAGQVTFTIAPLSSSSLYAQGVY